MTLSDRIAAGDRLALARGLTVVENGGEDAAALLDALAARTGGARRIGLTGPPGAGKSTIASALARAYRAEGLRVGVVAVDPTSPFTGGALLGDRHRLGEEAADEGLFFRSLASRGGAGGLARAAPDALDLLDAAGFALLLLETVGVGQSEIEVASTADSVVVVLSPESGDAVQAMKAGLLEAADVLCVNKSDREGSGALAQALEAALDRARPAAWRPPVVRTDARADADALKDALAAHAAWQSAGGRLAERRRRAARTRLERLVGALLVERLLPGAGAALEREAAAVAAGSTSTPRAASRVVKEILP